MNFKKMGKERRGKIKIRMYFWTLYFEGQERRESVRGKQRITITNNFTNA